MSKNVIITGASGGIGRELVEIFHQKGYNIWVVVRRKSGLEFKGEPWIKEVMMNLEDEQDIQTAFSCIYKEKKSIDLLINNAGLGHLDLFQMTTMNDIRKIYEVNVFAPMKLSQLVLKLMIRQKNGQIINIASTAADEVYVGNSIYGSSKAALIAFSKSLAAEAAPFGVRVNCVAPGLTNTQMSTIFEAKNPNKPLERTALERKIEPKELAETIFTLTTEQLSLINGQVFVVNGGSK